MFYFKLYDFNGYMVELLKFFMTLFSGFFAN